MAKKVYITEFDANGKPYYRTLTEMENRTHKAASKIDNSFKKIGAGIATYFAGREIFEFAKDSVLLASKLQGVKTAFEKLGSSVKTLEILRKATKGTVSELQLMQAAVKADNFKIPLNLLAKGLEFANKRAIQTGESVEFMVDSFITGVARKSIPILDNLGISQLTLNKEIEKTGDFYTAIGNIVSEENLKMSSGIDTATESFARLNAQIENTKTSIGEKLLPVWGNFLSISSALLDDWTLLFKYIGDPYAIQKAMYRQQGKYAPGSGSTVGTSLLPQMGVYGSITPNMFAPGPTTPNQTTPGNGKAPRITGGNTTRDAVNSRVGASGILDNVSARGISGFSRDMQEVAVPELQASFDDISLSFVQKFGETQNIAGNIANIFNVTADSFVGKLMQAFDVANSVLSIIASVASLAGSPLGFLGLAQGGTVVNKNGKLSYAPIPKFARGGSYMVPAGYSNDSGLIRVQSGERVDVTPSNQVPMLGKALNEIKQAIMAGNMNSAKRGGDKVVVVVRDTEQAVERSKRVEVRQTKGGFKYD